ncbi:MAG: response regulator [Alphaproteobacteria bacterium]|nr:response regulator [Alphaproteobacteria bacterium]
MMVNIERIGLRVGRATSGRDPGWIRSIGGAAQALAAIASFGTFYLAWTITGSSAQATEYTMFGLAGISGIAAFAARWAQGALADRLDLLRLALDAAPDAQLIVAGDGRMAYANLAFDHLFPGRCEPPLDRIESSVAADPESVAELLQLRSRAAAGVRATAAVSLRDACGGAVGRFNISSSQITGRPGYSFLNIRDITARDEMETVIRDERNKLVDFFDHAPIGFYSVDGNGRLRFVNRTLAQWLGSTPSKLIASGAVLHDFIASLPAEETPPSDPFGSRDDGTQRGEVLLKTLQGRIVPAWIGQSVVGSGPELRTRSVVCDLTPEREWKAALRLARRFQRFFANAPIGSALLDRSGRFEEVNRALGELFGVAPQELIGRELIGLLNEEDRDGIAAKLAAAADGRTERDPIEIRVSCPREKTIILFLSRIDDVEEDTSVTGLDRGGGFTLHFIDVTEQKNLEVQFAQSQKMQAVGQLAGGVAHDFNNLLTAMIGFCDLLLLRFQPGDPSFADIMQIQQNANRAANLVRQLLAFSRQQTLQPRVLSITDVLVDLSHLLRRLIGENIELKVVHGRDLGPIKVDQGQLEQVIINLAVNARDAMPSGGTLTIRTTNVRSAKAQRRGHEVMPAGDYVLIRVADTGVGIPGGNLTRIFDPFFSTKELGSGTGLGLSTVYGIVKQTGGFVFVDSYPGRGAVFEIYLPRHDATNAPMSARPDANEPSAGKDLTGRGTVLLVEDEDPVRKFGARALRNKGYKVIEAESGEAALEVIRNAAEKIDLLITDVVMPRLDGPGLVREVREIRSDIKVIFISGYAEDAFRQRLDRDSDIDFLSKPFSLKQLATKVKEVISGGAV